MKEYAYKAAFSEVDITPEFQTSLIGCYRSDNRSQGVLHRLYAQVLLFHKENDISCIIAVDNLGLTVQLSKIIRSKVATTLNTDISNIMLNFSHTHSAPGTTPLAQNGEEYFNFLCEQVVKCVKSASKNYVACKAGWSLTEVSIGENRREGSSITDKRLGALIVTDSSKDKPIAIVMRVASHANVLMHQNTKISSDFFGVAREELQKYYKCPIMILQGAAGNIKPSGVETIGGGNLKDLDRVVKNFVCAAKNLSFNIHDIYDIQMFSKRITFYSDVPSKEEAEKIAAEGAGLDAADWLQACEDLRSKGVLVQSLPAEIGFFKLNEGCICGVAEEIFCELALKAQKRTNNPLLFLNGYTNGCTGYLPNREEWHKGGYEVLFSYFIYHQYHGHVMPYRDDTADQIIDLVVNEWEQMKKRY